MITFEDRSGPRPVVPDPDAIYETRAPCPDLTRPVVTRGLDGAVHVLVLDPGTARPGARPPTGAAFLAPGGPAVTVGVQGLELPDAPAARARRRPEGVWR